MKVQVWWVLVLGFLVVALAHPEEDKKEQDVESNLEEKHHTKRGLYGHTKSKHAYVEVGTGKSKHKDKTITKETKSHGHGKGHEKKDKHKHHENGHEKRSQVQQYVPVYAGHLYSPEGANNAGQFGYGNPYLGGQQGLHQVLPHAQYGAYPQVYLDPHQLPHGGQQHGQQGGHLGQNLGQNGYEHYKQKHHEKHHGEHKKDKKEHHKKKDHDKKKEWFKLPFIVRVKVPVNVPKPYPVYVPEPYPVTVLKPVPYPVVKKIPYPVGAHPQQQQYPAPHVGQVPHQAYNIDPRLINHPKGLGTFDNGIHK